ncbi:hypothetical protein [Burkholderia sp. BCC0322]|uniref:hypothetical protein n=1 Tax=unclassified Burkholderia TaxID=2613784 RepID=UPI001589F821|nr:hypothetical protein [Burkholderia sp. BCC0322]
MRTLTRSRGFGLAGLTAALLAASTANAAAEANEARAVPLVEVANTAAPDRDWPRKVCELASASCGAAGQSGDADSAPSLYRARNDAAGLYYAILPGPQLLQVSFASGTGWKVVRQWDFSDYPLTDRVEGDGEPPPLRIYPALYPLGGERFAVAVLAGWSESYSGGGGSWENADFVELRPDGGHARTPRAAKLPFSCSKHIRACFTEHDYRHSPHCSEDFDGSLRLRFVPGASAGSLDWIATWKESHWPGQEPRGKTGHTSVSVTLPAGRDPVAAGNALRDKIPFCEPVN